MKNFRLSFLLLSLILLLWGCTDDGPSGPDADDFDRQAILVNWADNLVIPAFEAFEVKAAELDNAAATFTADPTDANFNSLKSSFEEAYLSFQSVSMYEIGPAMIGSQRISLSTFLNSYPTNTDQIDSNIASGGSTNLELPSQRDSQGFPALDYLLFGAADGDAEILNLFSEGSESEAYRTYLTSLTGRIQALAEGVLNQWQTGYRNEFVENSGNGGNASIDMMVNDYIFYYEKWLRAGKIGIPAGVFSGTPLPGNVEAYYHGNFSRELALEALGAAQNFFNGAHFDGSGSGESLKSYLDYLDTRRDGSDLSALINTQFENARTEIEQLNQNFAQQVDQDNTRMLRAYDELQQNVVYMKVDMLQALNINVDYVDADGD
jgi:hypothetical protein